ncbi:MAG: CsgG/HfaB family protein, partial [Bacteroidota bacterium]
KLIEGRYRTLTREVVQRQFQMILADEEKLGTERIAPKAVAVFPLAYQGTDPKYDALGKGLSEMMLIDLGQVKNLQIIERIRIETLLEELKFGQTDKVDRTTAPRLGKLLSAGRVVSGTFNVNNYNLRMDVAAWDIINKKFPDLKTESDDLDNLFKVEKQLVFNIIKELGVTLTPEEREKIQFIPTRNAFAFIMYCLGLKSEDARDYRGARVYYNQAATVDPNFGLAKTKIATIEAFTLAGGAKENALVAAEQIEPGSKKTKKGNLTNLVIDRLGHLGDSIGSTFRPGQDDRRPVQEGVEAVEVRLLPEPPRPPGK